jgi:tetratricopeptide (TPR) repeat protein
VKGEGQLTLVVGEPGIGKSRLVEEFRARLGDTPHTFVEWSSLQLLQNTPLHPIAEWGRLRFGGADVAAEKRRADLENTLTLIGLDAAEYAPLLAPIFAIPLPEGRSVSLPPEELRRRQMAAMTAWVLAGARSQPVAIAFEDLHWADPTSLDLMRALAERGAQAPLFIVATARPEFRPSWGMRPHHSAIALAPLGRAEVARMVSEIASGYALSWDVIEEVSERTGGVPLFVEEVTRLLLERGEQGGAEAIPPTLQLSLAARLDRLGSAREIAQIGAVLGRDFSYALLASVAAVAAPGLGPEGGPAAAVDGRGLQSALDRLIEADILIVEGVGHEATYRFKHALIKDAANESLLQSRRQAVHRHAAEVLREAGAEPEEIAHHYTEAGLDNLAIEWWGKAGDRALRRTAFEEAIAHLGKATAMADKLAATVPTTSTQRAKLKTDYGHAVMWSKGFAASETRSAFGNAEEGKEGPLAKGERLKVYMARFLRSMVGGELLSARAIAEDFARQAAVERDTTAAAIGRRHLGMACLYRGELTEARRQLELALRTSARENAGYDRSPYFPDTETATLGWLAVATWALGEAEQARRLIEQAVVGGQEFDNSTTMVSALWCQTLLETFRDDPAAALPASKGVATLARAHNMAHFVALAEIIANWVAGRRNNPAAAAKALRVALARYMDDGNRIATPWIHGLLAELQFASSDANGALSAIDGGLGIARETEEHLFDSFLYRLRGDILSKRERPDLSAAEQAYWTAVTTAVDQHARSWGLRAALSLAKLYQSSGRVAEAHAVLAPGLEGFSPTVEMPQIAEAQALLERLGAAGAAQSQRKSGRQGADSAGRKPLHFTPS